ncbi:MAG: SPOR domain-containing protein [Thermodesulfobacteriota bacterium]
MTQAEYKRPHNAGRRKMAAVTLLVLVLCLTCFALGIMVGGSGSDSVAEKSPDNRDKASVSASVRDAPDSMAAVSDSDQGESEQAVRQDKNTAEQEQTSGITGSAEMRTDVKKPAQTQEAVVQEVPLGSGINPRKNAVAENGVAGSQEVVPETGSEAQVIPDTASQKSPPAPSAEKKESTSAAQVSSAKDGKYVIQVASFRTEADARALTQKIKSEFPAYVREVDLDGKGVWFRVLVGPWAQQDEADDIRRRVKESVKLDGFVKRAP